MTAKQKSWCSALLKRYFPFNLKYQDEDIEPYLRFAKKQILALPRCLQYPDEPAPVVELGLDIPKMLEDGVFPIDKGMVDKLKDKINKDEVFNICGYLL